MVTSLCYYCVLVHVMVYSIGAERKALIDCVTSVTNKQRQQVLIAYNVAYDAVSVVYYCSFYVPSVLVYDPCHGFLNPSHIFRLQVFS